MLYPFVKKSIVKKSLGFAGAVAALALGGAQGAQAQTFTFVNDLSDSKVVTLTGNGGSSYFNGYAGRYKGQIGGGPVTNIFCVDINHEIQAGDTYAASTQYGITSPAGAFNGTYYGGGLASALTNGDLASVTLTQATARAGEVAYLADNFLNATGFTGAAGSADLGSNLTAVNMSIWDIVQDGGDGLGSGSVRAGASDAGAYGGLVGYYETLAAGHTGYTSNTATWIQAPESPLGQHMQDYVYEKPAPAAVPEPGMPTTLLCLALAGGGLWLRRRKTVKA